MKRIGFICLGLCILLIAFPVFAADDDQDIFVKTVPIIKILSHELGYKVLYYKVGLSLGEFYLPYEWFNSAGGTANIVWGNSVAFPYFSVYWVDGKFDHIKLFVLENLSDPTWGILHEPTKEIRDKFDTNKENFVLEF